MDRAFLTASSLISASCRNWNSEFQLAWEMEDNTISQAESRMEQLRRIEKEFVAEATRTVKQIVMLDDDGPRELPKFLQCYRVDNIFFRVLPDSRSGRNYVASLRGVLQSRTRLLTVPLSCMFFFRGMPVLAQALVPMPRDPTRLYGAGSTNNQEVEAEILNMAEALNIPLPRRSVCDVYEGLDGRWYCTLTSVTTMPVSERLLSNSPLKRQEMLFCCQRVTDGPEDVLSVLRAPPVLDALTLLKGMDQLDAQMQLCDTLHFYGVNLCFLKEVLRVFIAERGSDTEAVKAIETCVIVEMFARAIKQEFYLRVQSNRTAYDDAALQDDLARNISRALDADEFEKKFFPVIMRKYNITSTDQYIFRACCNICSSRTHDIITRFSLLIGGRTKSEGKSHEDKLVWIPEVRARVIPPSCDPSVLRALSEQYNMTTTTKEHMYAFCLPIQAKVAFWENNLEKALRCALEVAAAQKARHGDLGLSYLYALRDVCELFLSGDTVELIANGCKYLDPLLTGFQKKSGPLTQMRRHIECGCWLLGASVFVDLKAEALNHFLAAARLTPSELRSDAGAWLYARPLLGILRCKQMMKPTRLLDISDIARGAMELARIVTPTDYFVEFLWELGMESRCDRKYEVAAKLLHLALSMCKRVARLTLDVGALTEDLINVYREWDPAKYGAYCDSLLSALS